jgi:S1-C subfamily serine protease
MKPVSSWKLLLAFVIAGGSTAFALPEATDYIDSTAALGAFARKLAELNDAGETTSVEALREQAAREEALTVKLSRRGRRRLAPSDLYRRAKPSVVTVGRIYKCDKCDKWHASSATGFVVSEDGIIVTNYHVLKRGEHEAPAMGVLTHDGRVFAVREVLAASEDEDLLVLRIGADDLPPLAVAEDVAVGEPVWVISHPAKHLYTFTDGMVAGKLTRQRRGKPRQEQLAITADFAKGSSGAPVLNAYGAVVGIVRSTSPVYYEKKAGCTCGCAGRGTPDRQTGPASRWMLGPEMCCPRSILR